MAASAVRRDHEAVGVPHTYSGDFGAAQAERLLWRAGFGPRPGQAAELAKLGMGRRVLSLTRPAAGADRPGAERRRGHPLAPYDH